MIIDTEDAYFMTNTHMLKTAMQSVEKYMQEIGGEIILN